MSLHVLSGRRLAVLAGGLLVLAAPLAAQGPKPTDPTADPTNPILRVNTLGFRQPKPATEATARVTSTAGSYSVPNFAPPAAPAYYPQGGPVAVGPYGTAVSYNGGLYGTFTGAANLVTAEGQFRIANQQSKLIGEQVKQSKVDTQRKAVDEWLYELNALPTFQDQRERNQWEELRRARNDPPVTEIWSGEALNALFSSITKAQRTGVQGPAVTLSEETLRHINFTSGTTRAGSGLLKDGGKLQWPAALDDTPFDKGRKQVDDLVHEALTQVGSGGQVRGRTQRELERALDALDDAVRANSKEMSITDSIDARRYVRELRDSCAVFKQADPAAALGAGTRPKASTVGELVDQMNAQGLRFASAVSGDEAAYRALYSVLATYDLQLSRLVSR